MRDMVRLALIVLLPLAAPSASAAGGFGHGEPQAAPDNDRQAILSVLEASAAEWNRGSVEGSMRAYWNSPDVTFSSGANTIKGYNATLDRYKRRYQAPDHEMGQLDYRDISIDLLCPDTAFVRGFWHLKQSGGKEPHGVFTLLMKKFPEGWRIVHDHSSGE